jgi:colanic acid/amylovoran biosynthesis glycosyltransferase
MKIAFIVVGFPSLSETFILNQITGLIDMGHEVEIFAQYNPEDKKVHPDVEKYVLMEQVHYFSIPSNKIKRILKAVFLIIKNFHKSPLGILKSLNVFKYGKMALSLKLLFIVGPFLNKRFDIIHCHFGPNGILGSYLKEIGIKAKLITVFHGYDMSSTILKNNDVYNKLFSYGDLFMPISDYWKSKLIKLGCDKKKIIVHRMGIDLERYKDTLKKLQAGEDIKILTIGRLVEKKGHEFVIRAIREVKKVYKNIEYIIVGDGPLRTKLESLSIKLGVHENVKIIGAVEQREVLNLYQQCHIFCLPSVTSSNGDQEGIPVVLMEAQALGIPVISTFHTGIPEVVFDGKSGFLVPEKDVDALAEKLEYLIEHPEIWDQMGRYGRKFVEEKYDIKKLNNQLVRIYQNLIDYL